MIWICIPVHNNISISLLGCLESIENKPIQIIKLLFVMMEVLIALPNLLRINFLM